MVSEKSRESVTDSGLVKEILDATTCCLLKEEFHSLGCRQAVRHWTLTPTSRGSNPRTPARKQKGLQLFCKPFFCWKILEIWDYYRAVPMKPNRSVHPPMSTVPRAAGYGR